MEYIQKYFLRKETTIQNKKINYYSSPTLLKNKFKHAFFSKKSSDIKPFHLSNSLNIKNKNCIINQIHSNEVVFSSLITNKNLFDADGIVCDATNQSLWIYTADCMPILFADKRKRLVAAIHCGRKGLEKKIIKNLIKTLDKLGTTREDILVAIGPSISRKNYFLDAKTLDIFYKNIHSEDVNTLSKDNNIYIKEKNSMASNKEYVLTLDLRKHAFNQLIEENIPNINIDISEICTYESNHEFNSWRRSKTTKRQWSFISS